MCVVRRRRRRRKIDPKLEISSRRSDCLLSNTIHPTKNTIVFIPKFNLVRVRLGEEGIFTSLLLSPHVRETQFYCPQRSQFIPHMECPPSHHNE